MNLKFIAFLFLIALSIITIGCSDGGYQFQTAPEGLLHENTSVSSSRSTWGIWQFNANPLTRTLEVTQLRTGSLHLNALPFLEPPPLVNLTLETLQFNGNIIETDIGLRHPFPGLTEFTGFDVCGLLISNGSVTGFNDYTLRMAGDNDTQLLNLDGYSRWWNPAEFPADGSMFGYKDGLLGAPDSTVNFNSTLNGYKYFCDDLDANEPLTGVTQANRGMFSAGKKNIRHYTIELGTQGLIFNYAVDASWTFPDGTCPWIAPDSFPAEANRPEAWRVNVTEVENTLWNDGIKLGGDLLLSIDVYDWFNASSNTIKVESLGNFPAAESSSSTGGGTEYATFKIAINDATPAQESLSLLISVESEQTGYGGLLQGKTITAYFTHTVYVSSQPGNFLADTPCPKWRYDRKNTGRSENTGPEIEPSEVWTVPLPQLMSPKLTPNGTLVSGEVWGSKLYGISLTGSINWQLSLDTWTQVEATICQNGNLFIATVGQYAPYTGTLYCISQEGFIKWTKVSPSGWHDVCVNISIDGESLYVGDTGGKFYALDPADGSEIWTFQTGGELMSAPAIADDGTIYFGSFDKNLYALNPTGTEKWHYVTGGWILAAPAIGIDGTIYFGSDDNKLYALDPSGIKDWELNLGLVIRSSVAIDSDGTLFVGSGDGGFSSIGYLWAVNPNGTVSWWKPLPLGTGTASPVVDSSGNVYITSVGWGYLGLGGFLNAYSPSGTPLWSKLVNGWSREITILPEGQIAVVTNCGNLGSGGLTLFQ